MADNFFGITDTGRVRDNNEDTFIAGKMPDGNFIAACVIDGVGGYEGGEIAARIARENIEERLRTSVNDPIESMHQALITANQKIYQENQQRNQQEPMACVLTLALADIPNNQFHYAHVGDTRLYLLRDETLVKVTKDHSFVGFLEDSGRLSEDEAMRHPKRNEINKALGFDPQIQLYSDYIETGTSPFLPGDLMLVCSDGLTDMVNAADITSILSSGDTIAEKCKALIDAANNAGGKDNVTVVLVQNDKKPLKTKAAKPVKPKKTRRVTEEATPLPVVEVPNEPVQPKQRKTTSNNQLLIALLSCVCIGFLIAFIWPLIFKDKPADTPPDKTVQVIKNRNEQEARLQDLIHLTTARELTLSDSLVGASITLSDTLLIQNDSLHLNGKGIILRADDSFNGPALLVSPNSKSIMLENIILENFDVGVLTQSKAVYFMNVQFRNCRVPMQYQPASASGNSVLSGVIMNDTSFSVND